jgi:hypothetical protein
MPILHKSGLCSLHRNNETQLALLRLLGGISRLTASSVGTSASGRKPPNHAEKKRPANWYELV